MNLSGDNPATRLSAHGMYIRSVLSLDQPDSRGVTDLIALTICPRNAHFFSEGRYPKNTPSAVKGRILHRTIKNLHDRYQSELHRGNSNWIPDGEIALEEYRIVENAAKVQGYPPLSLKQSQQLKPLLRAFHTIEARQFYPRIQAAEVSLSWLWDEAPGKPVLLEGKVDVVKSFDKSGIALWDYKTTKQPQRGSHEFRTYQRQMQLYAFLYRQCYKETPQEAALYFMQELAGNTAPIERPLKVLCPVTVADDEDVKEWLYDVLTKELEREAMNQWNPPPPEEGHHRCAASAESESVALHSRRLSLGSLVVMRMTHWNHLIFDKRRNNTRVGIGQFDNMNVCFIYSLAQMLTVSSIALSSTGSLQRFEVQ